MEIPFTQFLLPDGRTREVTFDCESTFDYKVKYLLAGEVRFECEMLSLGNVSLTVEWENLDGENETLAHELSSNNPEIVEATHRLIDNAYQKLYDYEMSQVS